MTINEVREFIAAKMDEIVSCFEPGVKISVLIRSPEHRDRDFMMTDDEIPALQEMLTRRSPTEGQIPSSVALRQQDDTPARAALSKEADDGR